ncbi:MAG: hypothetical protein KME07_08580 [Pegethrix bostrychoides GSE-TBD4-15B]|uniref:Uncharacterized protein n=1 Tax=Pegethrix bostrychoides GSE-TBD4-15B TaxID=2839662 RepID=A0A951PA64_9CYAN|nr:hypothetical protein [Pegethrix bostrychoides GSE-TBD4-15B]
MHNALLPTQRLQLWWQSRIPPTAKPSQPILKAAPPNRASPPLQSISAISTIRRHTQTVSADTQL